MHDMAYFSIFDIVRCIIFYVILYIIFHMLKHNV